MRTNQAEVRRRRQARRRAASAPRHNAPPGDQHQLSSSVDHQQPPPAGEQQQQGVLQSINKLRAFNHSLSLFLSTFDALSEHLNRVSTSIPTASRNPNPEVSTVVAAPVSELDTTVVALPISELGTTVLASPVSELDTSCRRWRALRKYVTTRLSDIDRLRAEVPAALRRAPNPARVVLNCISGGRYHLNNFTNKANERRVCNLILEFYLSGCFSTQHELIHGKIDSNAVRVAVEWRERIICEGGIASASAVDALGLALFLGSFGVPEEFSLEDLCELLLISKSEKEAHVLRRSPFLLEKMPGVINEMTSKDMHTEAVDFVLFFGLEEKFNPLSMLSCLLHKAKQDSEEEMRDEQLSLIYVKESNEKYLTVLESVAKCIEVHKLDTSEFDFNIEQRILETSCRRWKALRQYVTTHLPDVDRLRAEVPGALQRAPDPAQVVLTVIYLGRYYLHPPWAYEGANNPKDAERRVCILILEFYLSGCFPTQRDLTHRKIDSKAVLVAFEWRKRLISEGGIASASAVDSLGLLLFLGSFGVPDEFSSEDLYELLHLSKSEKEAHVLRQSPFLLEKMPGVINDMSRKDMHIEAVDLVFLFGLERFDPLSMLHCLLDKAKQASEEMREGQLSLTSVKESNEKYLTVLESVAKCLEGHKLDISGFDFNIEQRIMTLRTENEEIVQKLKDRSITRTENEEIAQKWKDRSIKRTEENEVIVQKWKDRNIKRNADEVGPLDTPETQLKRSRPSVAESTSAAFAEANPSSLILEFL